MSLYFDIELKDEDTKMQKNRNRKHPNEAQIDTLKRLLTITAPLNGDRFNLLSEKEIEELETSGIEFSRAVDKSFLKRRLSFLFRQMISDKKRWQQSAGMKYVHPDTLKAYQEYLEQQNDYLSRCTIVNLDTGKPLTDKDDKNVTLPDSEKTARKRYAEHCARAKAIVQAAKERGYFAMMCTITLPSRFHSMKFDNPKAKHRKLIPNPTYDFSTVYEGYQFLNEELRTIFRRFNNNFSSTDKEYFYINTVQPTESGTPHFHLILFAKPNTLGKFKEAYRKYCTSMVMDESDQNRKDYVEGVSVQWEMIKRKKGSRQTFVEASMNYISRALKYVTRAISEFTEDEHEDVYEAQCIAAFASNNRIRLIRYSVGCFSAYRAIRRGAAQGLFDGKQLSNEIAEVLSTFCVGDSGKVRPDRVDFKRFEELIYTKNREGSVESNFSFITETALNRYNEKVEKNIGFVLFGSKFYFTRYKVVLI